MIALAGDLAGVLDGLSRMPGSRENDRSRQPCRLELFSTPGVARLAVEDAATEVDCLVVPLETAVDRSVLGIELAERMVAGGEEKLVLDDVGMLPHQRGLEFQRSAKVQLGFGEAAHHPLDIAQIHASGGKYGLKLGIARVLGGQLGLE